MSDFICQKYTDCSSCSHYQKQIFKYRSFPKGMMIPKERCSQNTIYFLISLKSATIIQYTIKGRFMSR